MNRMTYLLLIPLALAWSSFQVLASNEASVSSGLGGPLGSGIITYEVTVDAHRQIPPEREELKRVIPRFQTQFFELYFNEAESLYRPQDDPEADLQRGGRMMWRTPRTETHIDKHSREVTMLQDFLGTAYLIQEPLDIAPWRIGHQQMEILGYMCMMAWYVDTVQGHDITAWFTPQIQPFLGPDRYVTLPGTVLAVDINNGERVWVAREVKEQPVTASQTRKPTRGERISREAYDQMVREQMERLNSQGRGFRF